eukprot:2456091-Alexandrium_andersonii.AAC.1
MPKRPAAELPGPNAPLRERGLRRRQRAERSALPPAVSCCRRARPTRCREPSTRHTDYTASRP